MGVLRDAGVESGTEVAPVQSRAQSEEAARLLPGIYVVRPHLWVGATSVRGAGGGAKWVDSRGPGRGGSLP